MGNGGFSGTQPQTNAHLTADPLIGPSTSNLPESPSDPESSNDMACDNCSARFNLFRTKKYCKGCKIHFCNSCLSGPRKICIRCKVLLAQPPIREELMELRVKDLQRFILSKQVSMKSCLEKKDLVELVIRIRVGGEESSTASSSSSSSTGTGSSAAPVGAVGESSTNKDFPKNYVASSHREEWISKHNLQEGVGNEDSEDVALEEDFVFVSPSDSSSRQPDTASTANDGDGSRRGSPRHSPGDPPTSSTLVPPNPPVPPSSSSPKRFSHQGLVQLSEIETEEDLLELSVKQMKEILALNRVMFKGVIEKEELLKIVQRLWLQDKRNNEDKDNMDDEEMCKICMDAKVDCVMLECGHMCTCIACGKIMSECPICRRYVVRVVKIFKA
eukprot:TRINITY_DN2636_c0_g1_i4.p1 TRINITY_DN2636_c0_g1~~TRINITY_DN2636_c0_g1_i4.p1  ORF type:complete len:387 (+),score=106.34 TRINITY_DN2636_c0_g1_i4:157-1317(+)